MIKFVFLGVSGALHGPDGGNTSILVKSETARVCIDISCRIETVVREDIDALILTHYHIDHIYGLPSLLHRLWLAGRERRLSIYASEETGMVVNRLIDLFRLREKKGMFDICICSREQACVGEMTLTFFDTVHAEGSRGVIIQERESKLVYTSDTSPLKEIHPAMCGTNVLIHEASGPGCRARELCAVFHSSGSDAARAAHSMRAKVLYLCHLPVGEEKEILEEARHIYEDVFIAEVMRENEC